MSSSGSTTARDKNSRTVSRSSSSIPEQQQQQQSDDNNDEDLRQKRKTKRILLIDDELSIRESVGQFLYQEGYQVVAAPDASTALEVLKKATSTTNNNNNLPVDLIICDICMPGELDGLDLLQIIRQNEEWKRLPVILLTAKGRVEERIVGYQTGADAYIPKPFDAHELLSLTDGLLQKFATLNAQDVRLEDVEESVLEIKRLLLEEGGGGSRFKGWVDRDQNSNGQPVFLTVDERRVLQLVCEGYNNKDTAELLDISLSSVIRIFKGLYAKTETENRTTLIRWAISTGQVKV